MSNPGLPELKGNWRQLQRVYKDDREPAQIIEHYMLERELAAELLNAQPEERLQLYGPLYDRLYAQLSHHPRFTRRYEASHAGKQVAVLKRLAPRAARFLEIGGGDCSVSLAMSDFSEESIAVDVTERAIVRGRRPTNFRFVLSDGVSLPIESDSIDFAYSHQLMEHLHPDDAEQQLADIFRVLRPGGRYFCITPSRLTGPHDVSRYFEHEARGFHLKEYSYRDLSALFGRVGFDEIQACITRGSRYAGAVPISLLTSAERAFGSLPVSLRELLSRSRWVRAILGLSVLARKPDNTAPLLH